MAEKYLCHKSTDPRKVTPKKRRDLLTSTYIAQNYSAWFKYDGCQAIIKLYTDGRLPMCYSRTGEEYVSFLPAAKELAKKLHSSVHHEGGLVVFAEAWKPDTEFRHLSGEFRRGEQSDTLQLMVWDVVTMAEFDAGVSTVPFRKRLERVQALYEHRGPLTYIAESWDAGTYGVPQDLSNALVKAGGSDGAVFRDMEAGWERGKENGDESLKIKAEESLDLRVTAVHEALGEKTGRTVYTVDVEYKGTTTRVGSGIPHSFDAVPKVGDIIEVLCMAINKNNTLREPRFKGIRHDKTQPDG